MGHIGGLGIDMDISKTFQRSLKKQGMNFMLNHAVTGATKRPDGSIEVALSVSEKGVVKSGGARELGLGIRNACDITCA